MRRNCGDREMDGGLSGECKMVGNSGDWGVSESIW